MNMRTRLLLCCGFLFAICLIPASAKAQQAVTCESNDGNRKYCGSANPGQVSMQRQISGSACIQGQSWGVDNQGLWVDKGCRAEFLVGGWNNGGGNSNSVTCESNNGRRNYCGAANPNQVSMQRQLSSASCTQGQSWGVDNQGLWVDRGCRAVFTVGNGWNNNGGNWNGGNNNWNNNGGTVTCESNDGNRKYCGNASPGQVSLQRQISGSACVQGQSWGVDNQGLWVDRGCRAVFTTNGNNWNGGGNGGNWNGGGNGSWNTWGNSPAISNYRRVTADTSGHGNFNSQNMGSGAVTRGYIDTKGGRPSVSLSGSGFKVTFYGDVVQSQDRRLVIRITDSSRGPARGVADIYLNGDKNEVQSLHINGDSFNGDFDRK